MEKAILIAELVYLVILVGVIIRIIYDTHNSTKTLGYLLLVIFLPVFGIIFYFSFGVNYRKRKLYNKKIIDDNAIYQGVTQKVLDVSYEQMKQHADLLKDKVGLAQMALSESYSLLSPVSNLKLLVNGEEKFPEVLAALENAKHHIHIEYYIYTDDVIGNQVKDILIRKAKEGVEVRFIYDDFASHSLGRKMAKELRAHGVEVFPFYKIKIFMLANRMNYRNHRKIIVVDGMIGFIGGINVDDRYINDGKHKLYWRDTHLMVEGAGVVGLQHTFISDWNFCSGKPLQMSPSYFPIKDMPKAIRPDSLVQMISSGPDSKLPGIMLSYMGAISSAKQRIYITTPYFIPSESIANAIKFAALKGVDVRLIVPGVSDSRLVNAASRSNYQELLDVGVRIYLYQKGFVHAKSMVVDDNTSIVGTANMDIRSYDLNFEINAVVFDKQLNSELTDIFFQDLENCTEINKTEWQNRGKFEKFVETLARLVSPLL